MIGVVGGGLAGLSAAARLARAGHRVLVLESGARLGVGIEVATEPGDTVFTLPAAWRDLFRKSGRILDAELAGRGLTLEPAPARRFRFADGSQLALPTDRGEQWATLYDALGPAAAAAWRDLLDSLDDTWQVLRGLGVEAEFGGRQQLTPGVRERLRIRESLDQLAHRLPAAELTELVLDVAARLGQDPRRLPGWHAVRLAIERTFGRWHLTDAQHAPQPATVLVELLIQRLVARGVEIRTGVEVRSIRSSGRGFQLAAPEDVVEVEAVISTVSPRTHADLTRERADFRIARQVRRSPAGGPLWTSWRTLLDLPRLQPSRPGILVASAWSPAGADSWAQLLTGALAAYRVHAELTGEDMRPINKEYRPPRLPR